MALLKDSVNPKIRRESFDGIYLDLSKQSGKCRFAENGLGWKPSAGGDTFTLDKSQLTQASWSRAARGYEVKVLTREAVIQLDGFQQEVRSALRTIADQLESCLPFAVGLRPDHEGIQALVQH